MSDKNGKYRRWLTPEGLLLLEGWARDGLSDQQIAQNCGCCRFTLSRWKQCYPEIGNALQKGREVVDYEVENAFLKRALGYQYTETRTESGKEEKVVQTERHMPPNVSAAAFWLQRRRPDRWGVQPASPDPQEGATGCVLLPEVKDDD